MRDDEAFCLVNQQPHEYTNMNRKYIFGSTQPSQKRANRQKKCF